MVDDDKNSSIFLHSKKIEEKHFIKVISNKVGSLPIKRFPYILHNLFIILILTL